MAYTKRQIVGAAFEEIGIAGYDFDLQPDELETALAKLDGMMATWALAGIRIGYAGTGDVLDVDANIPGWAYEALYLNLALRLAPGFGKTPSMDTKAAAKAAKDAVMARTTAPRSRVITGYAGSGSRYWGNLVEPEPPIRTYDGNLDIIGG